MMAKVKAKKTRPRARFIFKKCAQYISTAGLTKEEIAKGTGLSRSTIASIIKGVPVSQPMVRKVFNFLEKKMGQDLVFEVEVIAS